ncbi:C40 family peptidase [Hymenobacter sp. ASUV-10]|uniref:C40 family peptidase n=1 Tax=Hymenobacter aranciens TaxID=3063996 RepID=A0ABT9B6Y6_9BACT|nr:C40 family peptidase [Hymenobacter sp. ASUV-10]MDO7873565.1 C40 family peptidase [Hymenobacter sp. ASUV-10]
MRFIWLTFVGLAALIIGFFRPKTPVVKPPKAVIIAARPDSLAPAAAAVRPTRPAPKAAKRDSIVLYALQQLGTNYCYAGTTPATGFDCSGFVQYVFTHFHVPVPHSTALLINVGQPVPRAQAQPGDIVVFTGTAKTSTTPGHAGIVVTAASEGPLRFVHSSSAKREPGVKISQVEGTDYERRFMQVRRVL